jgi:glycerophosphoryl diester phosphodiesterase
MDYGWLLKTPIAHRGLHNNKDVPENSLLSIERSVEHNFPIEIDVQMTADGKIIVFHDDDLLRLCGVNKSVTAASYNEIKTLHLLNTTEKIPLLTEALELLNSRQPILIEIKNSRLNGTMEKAIWDILSNYKGKYAIQSFNPLTLQWFKKRAPHILRGQLSSGFKEDNLRFYQRKPLEYMIFNFLSAPHFIAYDVSCLPFKPLEGYRKRGIPVITWTVKTNGDLLKAQKYADNYIFEGIHIGI